MDDREKDRRFRAERRAQLRRSVLIQTDTFEEIKRWLDEARTRIMATLAGTPSEFEGWRLGQLQGEVRRSMELFERGAGTALTHGLDLSWSAGGELVTEPLRVAGVDLSGVMPALDPRLLVALKSFQTDRIRDISTTTVNRINMEIGQVALGVQDVFAAARKVEDLIDAPRARALSIVRTELGTAYSEAGQQRMEQAVKVGVKGLQKQWRRSGKIHPRVTHDLADGQIVDVDKPFLVGGIEIPKPRDPSIPIGERMNCGCQSLPYMQHWRVSTPGPKPYTVEELARSPSARQADEARYAARPSTVTPEPRRFGSLEEHHAVLQAEYEPWAKGLSREERYAISHFKGFDGFIINDALRENTVGPMMTPTITSLDQAISRASLRAPTQLWRGEGVGTPNAGLQPGDVSMPNAGFLSATIRPEMAEGSADGGVLLEFVLPAGYPAAYIQGVPIPITDPAALADSEFEMILPRGLRFRVLERQENRMRVELLP